MTHVDVSSSTLKKVKEIVDFIYGVTIGEGSSGGWGKYSSRTQLIVKILVARGILQRTGPKPRPHYVWVATMAPTATLYRSIAESTVIQERENMKKQSARKKKRDKEVKEEAFVSLASFQDQELWDELKRRGYSIEGNQLVITKKEYLS